MIHVTVVVDTTAIAPWQETIVRGLSKLDCIQSVHLIALEEAIEAKRLDPPSDPALLRWYRRLDERLFGVKISPQAQPPLCPEVVDMIGWTDRLESTDLFLNLGEHPLPQDFSVTARRGEISLRLGSRSFGAKSVGFFEVLENEDCAAIDLWIRQGDNEQLLARSFSAVDATSISRTLANCLTNGLQLMIKAIGCLADGVGMTHFTAPTAPMFQRDPTTPTGSEVAFLAGGHALSFARRKVSQKFVFDHWHIGFHIATSESEGGGALRYLDIPRDRFWADPFPVDAGDKLHIFFEEKLFSEAHGTICVATMNAAGALEEVRPALMKPYHLSYPFLFEFSGDRFMIPETGGSGKIEIYKAKTFPHKWELVDVLMEGIRAADCTLVERDGTWWMFVGRDYHGLQMGNELLSLFYASSPFGPWHPHPRNPIKLDVRNARGAGKLFERNGELYRPSQDCSGFYGRAVNINHIKVLSKTDFEEAPVARIVPSWDPTAKGVHTYNRHGRLTVVDVLLRRPTALLGPRQAPSDFEVHRYRKN